MRVNAEVTAGVSASVMAALMLAVFTVSVGFGVVLPLLPYLIERLLGEGVEAAQISRHTGLLTAVYTLSLFLYGQRHAESAGTFQDAGAGVPLNNDQFCQQQWWAPVKNCCRCHSPGAGFEARSQLST